MTDSPAVTHIKDPRDYVDKEFIISDFGSTPTTFLMAIDHENDQDVRFELDVETMQTLADRLLASIAYQKSKTEVSPDAIGVDWQAVARENKREADYWRSRAMAAVARPAPVVTPDPSVGM